MIAALELTKLNNHLNPGFTLKNVSLNVFPGEVHMIIGENGSGKSAIMKSIVGQFNWTSGDLTLNGQPIRFHSIHDATNHGVVYHHQDLQLFDNLTIAENIYIDEASILCSPLSTRDKCQKLLNLHAIPLDASTKVGQLGYAEKQLVAVARSVSSNPSVIIFDEPTSGMSDGEREIFFIILKKLKDSGTAIIYISHRFDEIQLIGDRISVVYHGEIIATHPVRSIDRSALVHLMTGRQPSQHYPHLQIQSNEVVLSVRNIKSNPVINDVSFNLFKSEILGITGLMGSGRTRLAHCLVGAVPLDFGEILLRNKRVRFTEPGQALQAGIVLVPEDRLEEALFPRDDLLFNMTISSLHRFVANHSLDDETMFDLVNQYSERLAIKPGKPGDIVGNYSGGNQQKSMIARAFMNLGSIYILDEPTRGIDVAAKIDIYNAMNDLVAKGASVILFSSDIEEIIGMSDRILVLNEGKFSGELLKKEATKDKILELATSD
jgi:ABC-type sugar transport system ATPase subunit